MGFATSQNAIKIETQAKDYGDTAVGAFKFGGQLDLPASVPWPSNENGALSFVAQINFAEVSKFDTEGLLPKSGMLYLFYDINFYAFRATILLIKRALS